MAESGVYQVEEIITHTVKKGKNYFLIKWVGYPSSQNTWEPKENLEECREYVESYLLRKNGLDKASRKISKERACSNLQDSRKHKFKKEKSTKKKATFNDVDLDGIIKYDSQRHKVMIMEDGYSTRTETNIISSKNHIKATNKKTQSKSPKKEIEDNRMTKNGRKAENKKHKKKKGLKPNDNCSENFSGSHSGLIELDIPVKIETHIVLKNHFMEDDERGVCYFKIIWKQRPSGITPKSSWYEKDTLMMKYPDLINQYYENFLHLVT